MARKHPPLVYAKKLLSILYHDDPKMDLIDRYAMGQQRDPWMPPTAGPEYYLLAQRSKTNVLDSVVKHPVQMLYVDGVRPGRDLPAGTRLGDLPEWVHWQNSDLDRIQIAVHQGALRFGHSFALTEKRKGKVVTKGLSARRTAALYEDPANDKCPLVALTITEFPEPENEIEFGTAYLYDDTWKYPVSFKDWADTTSVTVHVGKKTRHGASICPIVRFAPLVDLEGRTIGLIEPLIVLQDRLNQTVFDLLMVQTYGAFKVRTVSGMAPPYIMERVVDDITGQTSLVPKLDENGRPMMDEVQLSAMRILFASDPETKFGSLDETPLDGYLAAIVDTLKTLSALAQIPAHYVLGLVPNLAAEAMQAAETALERHVALLQQSFGSSWETVFRLAAEIGQIEEVTEDYKIEVSWKDMEARAMAKAADAAVKLFNIGVPPEVLITDLPGMTTEKADDWIEAIRENKAQLKLAEAISGATTKRTQASATSRTQRVSESRNSREESTSAEAA